MATSHIEVQAVDQLLAEGFAAEKEATLAEGDVGAHAGKDPTPMTESELAALIKSEMAQSYGEENSELAADRARAMDYYFNRPRGDEKPGHSQVQSSDVMDVVEWILPDLIEAFTTNEEAVSFSPVGPEDEKQSDLETRYVNHLFYNKCNGYVILYNFFKDALLQKNGIARVYWDDRIHVKHASYTNLSSLELAEVLEGDENTEVQVLEQEESPVSMSEIPEETQSYVMDLPEVQAQIAEIQQNAALIDNPEESQAFITEAYGNIQVMFYDIKVRMIIAENSVRVKNVAPENFHINEDHDQISTRDARFTCEEVRIPRSDLIEQGFDPEIVRDLTPDNFPTDEEDFARQYHTLNREYGSTLDQSMHLIRVRYCTMRVDFDGDGIAELRNIVMANEHILENEYADFIPFPCISPIMVPHRWVGVSIFDRIKQIQDIATAVWRQLLDNLYRANNNRTIAVENQVNMDDLLSSRPGGVVRAKNTDAIVPFPHTPIGPESYQLFDRLARTRMERSGVGPEMMSEGMVIDNDTAHGVERLMSAKEKLVAVIIRNFAETGVKEIFMMMHELLTKHQTKMDRFRVNGVWHTVNPNEWRWRNNLDIEVGLGAGNKLRLAGTLERVFERQDVLVEQGKEGILVSDEQRFRAHTDYVKFSGLKHPSSYFMDPTSPEAMQTKQARAKAAQEPSLEDKIIMLEAQIEQMDAQLRHAKQSQEFIIKQNEQQRKWIADQDESARAWTELEINADKDLGPEGRAK